MRVLMRELRQSKELSIQDVANSLGVDRTTYNNIELGKTDPSFKLALKLKEYFNCNTDDIFE